MRPRVFACSICSRAPSVSTNAPIKGRTHLCTDGNSLAVYIARGSGFFAISVLSVSKDLVLIKNNIPPISTINVTTTLTGGALLGDTSSPEFVPCATNLHSSSFGHRGPVLPAFLAFWPAHVSASKFNQNGRTGHHPRPPVSVTLVCCCPCAYPFNPYSSPYFSPR